MSVNYKEIQVVGVEDDVIFIENEDKVIFGIISGHTIVDQEFDVLPDCALKVIEENFDCEVFQDWAHETTTIFTKCKGKIVFIGDEVEFLESNETMQ